MTKHLNQAIPNSFIKLNSFFKLIAKPIIEIIDANTHDLFVQYPSEVQFHLYVSGKETQ